MSSLANFINFFQAGQFFMYPILLVLAVGTAIVVERLIVITRCRVNGETIWNRISPVLVARRVDEALQACSRSSKPLYHVLSAGIRGMKGVFTREDVQGRMDEASMEVIPWLEARTHYLPNLANVATLLGLLGTIIGLIQAFTAVSLADPAQKATLLAKGISVAMNTTAFGLIVAIPLMLIYAFLQTRTNRIIDNLDKYALKLVNLAGQMVRENNMPARSSHRVQEGLTAQVGSSKGTGYAK